jgi:hypothetical protein
VADPKSRPKSRRDRLIAMLRDPSPEQNAALEAIVHDPRFRRLVEHLSVEGHFAALLGQLERIEGTRLGGGPFNYSPAAPPGANDDQAPANVGSSVAKPALKGDIDQRYRQHMRELGRRPKKTEDETWRAAEKIPRWRVRLLRQKYPSYPPPPETDS